MNRCPRHDCEPWHPVGRPTPSRLARRWLIVYRTTQIPPGERIEGRVDALNVPDKPVIPFIRGAAEVRRVRAGDCQVYGVGDKPVRRRRDTMGMGRPKLDLDRIGELCRRHRIRRLALFGSVLRDDFGPESDVDVLVEFEPGARVGWDFVTIQDELAELFGRSVDLLTPGSIRPAYRDQILSSAEDVYVAA